MTPENSDKGILTSVPIKPIKETDSLTIAEYATLFGFTPAALIDAIHRNRGAIKKNFYSITEIAERWNCSRATVYAVLRESELKVINVAPRSSEKRDTWRIPADVVEHLERQRSQPMSEAA